MKAKLISTEGPYLEAIIEINGQNYCVMDEISLDINTMPKPGETFDFEFCSMVDEAQSWDSIFQSNPNRKKCIEQIKGWKYRAFGEVISINPVKIDCGIFIEEDVIHSNDPRIIGEFVGFTINRLSGYGI